MKKLITVIVLFLIFVQAKAQLDWEEVEVANFESEITDLVKLDMVTSKAKGVTVYSSQGKMQTRAINKLKMMAAMLGGTTVLIMDQQSQSAQYGWGASTSASANISGVAYSEKLIEVGDISEGSYVPSSLFLLKTNDKTIETQKADVKYQVSLVKENLVQKKNGVQANITFSFSGQYTLDKWHINKVENDIVYMSGVHRTKGGKETYMTVILEKM